MLGEVVCDHIDSCHQLLGQLNIFLGLQTQVEKLITSRFNHGIWIGFEHAPQIVAGELVNDLQVLFASHSVVHIKDIRRRPAGVQAIQAVIEPANISDAACEAEPST